MLSSLNVNFGSVRQPFWGHVVSKEGIKIILAKIEVVQGWTRPTSATLRVWTDTTVILFRASPLQQFR